MPEGSFVTVRDVVAAHLCTQCGTCVAACPSQAVSMAESPGGMLLPSVQSEWCDECGTCVSVCPGLGMDLTALPEGIDPFRGPVLRAYLGHATDETTRAGGQSGGVGTALALHLLSSGLVDAVLLTAMPEDGSLKPHAVLARSPDEAMAASGSKYSQAGGNALLRALVTTGSHAVDEKVATFSLPCQTEGIEKMSRGGLPGRAAVSYRIGLFCDRSLLRTCTDQMLRDADLARGEVASVRYRSKTRSGWPGEVQVITKSGEQRLFPASLRLGLKEMFTVPRCRLCFDKTNVFADIALGDPWGISNDPAGSSVIIARTPEGDALLREAAAQGALVLTEISPQLVFEHQGLIERRRALVGYSDLWADMGRTCPGYEGLELKAVLPIEGGKRRAYRRNLAINCRLAEATSLDGVARSVRRHRLMGTLRSKASRVLRSR
ncbi:MAG: Coenzyme F420 hydrogenase/dehydrogenase, beta subunit C-terminal domain [Thermoleophilia bacterium]|nr:Coenzyme F420 hydrogenase/dehydrogenase, beta subunit C-terminal domain [Thermoleophilia bacterium]